MDNRFLKPKILGLIPARGGSKGIPNKNKKLLGDKPLITFTINSAKKSKLIDTLILSSDDNSIIEIAKDSGMNVPFVRPKHLATDDCGSLEVVQHAIEYYEQKNIYFDAVILLQPTTPFREDGFIDYAIRKFMNTSCESLISVLTVPHHFNPHWVFKTRNGFLQVSTGENEIIKRRQDLPKAFYRDGSIYITKTDTLKKGSFYGKKTSYVKSNPRFHVNIDSENDWVKAELIVKKYNETYNNG